MADRQSAAIRRGTQQAHNAMRELDAAAVAEIERIYRQAVTDVQAQITAAAAAGDGARVELVRLRALLQAVEAVLDAVATARTAVVEAAIEQAAELGVRPLTGAGLAATGRNVEPVIDPGRAAELVDQAVNFVRSFRPEEDGLALSDRLWRIDRGAKEAVLRTLEQSVVQGWGADRTAQEFMLRGQPAPPGTETARRAGELPNLVRGAELLQDPTAGPLPASLRVMRTEVNRAHGEAYMAGAPLAPGFVGFKFLLSPRHPRPDICDLLASQNLHGLGPGVYPDRKSTPWPAHPNTLSFIVAVFEEQLTEADRAGKETTLEALARLAPEIRAGVLGPTKATYFDQGLLTRGMVRSLVGDVQTRLRRTGRISGP